jgi:Zinc finger, C3HC4 type (RING finger)
MKAPSFAGGQGIIAAAAVPTLNSWPHFSSITSLNNLGTMPGVKSIASLSGADLASKGSLNKLGNLAQVKSMESMGKNDSYAFLEVFFGDRSSNNLSGMAGKDGKGQKFGGGGGEEDNEIGLSLEDESPSQQTIRKDYISSQPLAQPAPLGPSTSQESGMDSGMLKRAYDDALAARGLISVSRSSERLTDLVLPAKIQRTLSQEFINKQQQQQQFGQYSYLSAPTAPSASPGSDINSSKPAAQNSSISSSGQHQYAGQHPGEPSSIGEVDGSGHVQVPSTTRCALCSQVNVNTQLRPCGHMFHERCLKPSLQKPMGPPTCPFCNTPMLSALLAVPTDDGSSSNQQQQQQQQQTTSSWTSFQNSQSTETT